MDAAKAANAKVIGVDVDQYAEGEEIITSAMKGLGASTILSLTALMNNNWEWPADYAGKTATLGVAENSIGLPTAKDSWRLKTFTVAEYEALFAKLVSGEIVVNPNSGDLIAGGVKVYDNPDSEDVTEVTHITVDYQG